LSEDVEKSPNITDYLAAATLSYGIIFFWLKLSTLTQIPWPISYLIFYMGGLVPTFLVCRRTDRNQFPVAINVIILQDAAGAFHAGGYILIHNLNETTAQIEETGIGAITS